MTTIAIISSILFFIGIFFLWTVIHELAHYFMIKLTKMSVQNIKIKPWPHKLQGRWVSGSVEYTYIDGVPTRLQRALVSAAPRIPDIIAIIAMIILVFATHKPFSITMVYILLLLFGGIIDLVNSLFRKDKREDMVKFYNLLNLNKTQTMAIELSLAFIASVGLIALLWGFIL